MNPKIVGMNRLPILALVATALLISRPALAANGETAAVKQATAEFYSALNTMFTGDPSPMTKVWSHASDVTYMGPGGGFQVGWKKVLREWEKQAAQKLGGSVEPADMQLNVGADIAVVQDYEVGKNTNADGKTVKISLRATNIFRKEGGVWKMIGHHTDLLPYMQK